MKVLHVIPSVSERSGGPATAIVPMCRALMQQGVEVLLLSTTDGLPEILDVAEYKGVPARFFPPQLGASFKYSRPLERQELRSRAHPRSLQSLFRRGSTSMSQGRSAVHHQTARNARSVEHDAE